MLVFLKNTQRMQREALNPPLKEIDIPVSNKVTDHKGVGLEQR
jgi:hypothetical protein